MQRLREHLPLLLIALLSLTVVFAIPAQSNATDITVTDQAGRRVVIHQPVNRVVTTFIPATIFTLCAGLRDQLVGASNKDGTSSIYEALTDPDKPPLLVGNRSVGLNLETISSLRPDLVIMYGQKDGIRTADRLTALGYPAIVILPESLEEVKKSLQLIGTAAGTTAHTDRVIRHMETMEQDVTSRLAGRNQPKVYYATSNLLRTVSGDMLQNRMIDLAGGINVSGGTHGFFVNISREQLFAWNPEVLICSDRLGPDELRQLDTPELSPIAAHQQNRIYRIPGETYWDFPSPLAMAGIVWLASRIHPEAYMEGEVQSQIDTFYDVLFGEGFAKAHPRVVGRQ